MRGSQGEQVFLPVIGDREVEREEVSGLGRVVLTSPSEVSARIRESLKRETEGLGELDVDEVGFSAIVDERYGIEMSTVEMDPNGDKMLGTDTRFDSIGRWLAQARWADRG